MTITEKLDGSNVALTQGRILDRSGHPAQGPFGWLRPAITTPGARRTRPWAGPTTLAEDIYAVHAIEYGPSDRVLHATGVRRL